MVPGTGCGLCGHFNFYIYLLFFFLIHYLFQHLQRLLIPLYPHRGTGQQDLWISLLKMMLLFFQKTPGCVILSAVFRLKKGNGEAIAAKMRELNQRRRDKQPLDLPSAGSAFRRPENGYAAALIDEAGLKGYTVGGAQVSEKHAGFVVNTGKATSHDVYDLMMHIRKTVYEKSGTVLVPEMIILPPDYALTDNGPEVPLNRVTGGLEAELNAAAAQETPES